MSIERERLLSLVEFAQQSARLRTTPASTITQHGILALYEHQLRGLPGNSSGRVDLEQQEKCAQQSAIAFKASGLGKDSNAG